MTEAEWLAGTAPNDMLRFLKGKVTDRKLRLFVVACCRSVWDGLCDERSRIAVEMAERFADGNATPEELREARAAAYVAIDDCLNISPITEDLAVAAYLVAAPEVDEPGATDETGQTEDVALYAIGYAWNGDMTDTDRWQAAFLRDIFGNPFRPVTADPAWFTPTVAALARGIYDERAFDRLPVLADALHDAGCDHADVLAHCRGPGPHARGCWVVDLVLGKG